MMKKVNLLPVLAAACVCGVVGAVVGAQFAASAPTHEKTSHSLVQEYWGGEPAPAASRDGESVWSGSRNADGRHEFETNERGLSVGVPVGGPDGDPDLILAEATNGRVGYVYSTDLDGPAFASPEEARSWSTRTTQESSPLVIPVYELDGETIIGEFHLTPANVGD